MRENSTAQILEYYYCMFEYKNKTSGGERVAVAISQNPDRFYEICAAAAYNAALEMTRCTRIPKEWYDILKKHEPEEEEILKKLDGIKTSNDKARRIWLKLGRDRVHDYGKKDSGVVLHRVSGLILND